MNGFHLLKTAQFMTFWYQFGYWSLMQSSSYQQNDVVDHITEKQEKQSILPSSAGYFSRLIMHNGEKNQ